jgi:hypothetical protein
MEYGKLIIELLLSKSEARAIEDLLSYSTHGAFPIETLVTRAGRSFEHTLVTCRDIQVSEVGHNVQYLTVKGTA